MATVIRAFADPERARQLHEKLIEAGLPDERARLLRGDPERASAEGAAGSGEEPGDRGLLSSLGHFFVSALGADGHHERHGPYADALQRGESVIAVNAVTPGEENVARAILDGVAPR